MRSDWVKDQNQRTLEEIGSFHDYHLTLDKAREILLQNEKDQFPLGEIRGNHVYHFYLPGHHPKGVWRRISIARFDSEMKDGDWEILLDLEKLSREEGKDWHFKGALVSPFPGQRAMVTLALGEGGERVDREFDLEKKSFPKEGFLLTGGGNLLSWYDQETLIIGTDSGQGTLTRKNFPRILKKWKRHLPLSSAPIIFEGRADDYAVFPGVIHRPEGHYFLVFRYHGPENCQVYLEKEKGGTMEPLSLPADSIIKGVFENHLLVALRSPWVTGGKTFLAGSLAGLPLKGPSQKVSLIVEPDRYSCVAEVLVTRTALLVSLLENVQNRVLRIQSSSQNLDEEKTWEITDLDFPRQGTIQFSSADDFSPEALVGYESFLRPPTWYRVNAETMALKKIKSSSDKFIHKGLVVHQYHATSSDGTKIPYFVIGGGDLSFDGRNPTLLYGHGGFNLSLVPKYLGMTGNLLPLEKFVFVQANIRGGGEFGPSWHKGATGKWKFKAFEDFISVAHDLMIRKITSPAFLGIKGGGHGGLLTAVAMTQRPELFRTVICKNPLFPGESLPEEWKEEFGDGHEAEVAAQWKKYSPHLQLKKGQRYPHVLFIRTGGEDYGSYGETRHLAARMGEWGNRVYYFENLQGPSLQESAMAYALEFALLKKTLAG